MFAMHGTLFHADAMDACIYLTGTQSILTEKYP